MRIIFCLPEPSKNPTGGFKIVFEYANRLAERGHDITLVFFTHQVLSRVTTNMMVKKIVGDWRVRRYPKWFSLNQKIAKVGTPYLDGRGIPEADIVFATAVSTADTVRRLPEKCGKKVYFIQGFETWIKTEKEVIESYQYGFLNCTVSKWLDQLVSLYSGQPTVLLPNAIDTTKFYIESPIFQRNPKILALLYHESESKGLRYAFEAINLVKERYPDLRVNCFGVPDRPAFLPDYYTYYQSIDQDNLRKLYNDSAIFVCATIDEGFGLTGAESMACGCAFASTAYSGVFEYANSSTAMLSPVKDSRALADNIILLIENDELRVDLAKKGNQSINDRTWERNIETLESHLRGLL